MLHLFAHKIQSLLYTYCRGPGSLALVLSWCITLYTLWLMIQLHECVPGTRFDRYRDLGQYAFGPKLGLWIVVPQQLIVQLGCDIVYMVTGGKCLEKFMEIIFPSLATMHTSYWICFFGAIQFFLSQLPDLNSMSAVSFAAAVMSLRLVLCFLIMFDNVEFKHACSYAYI